MGLLLILAAEATETPSGGMDWRIGLLFVAVVGMVIVVPRLLRKSREERLRLEKRYHDELNGNTTGIRHAADQILIQVVETGREINGVLDTKIRVLNKLIKDAEEAARRLEALTAAAALPPGERLRVNGRGDADGEGRQSGTQPNIANTAQAAALAALASLRAAAGSVAADAARAPLPVLSAEDAPAPAPSAESAAAASGTPDTGSGRWKADIRGRIRAYAEEGRSADEIARLTRLSRAEVNLMLDLLRSEQTS